MRLKDGFMDQDEGGKALKLQVKQDWKRKTRELVNCKKNVPQEVVPLGNDLRALSKAQLSIRVKRKEKP